MIEHTYIEQDGDAVGTDSDSADKKRIGKIEKKSTKRRFENTQSVEFFKKGRNSVLQTCQMATRVYFR